MEEPVPERVSRRPTVLVVEDEPIVRMVIADGLRDAGFAVVEADSGAGAIDFLAAGGHVDVVFSDIQLGEMSGLELAAQIRTRYPSVLVILTSSDPGPVNLAELGPFIAKPYAIEAVVAVMRRAIPDTEHDRD